MRSEDLGERISPRDPSLRLDLHPSWVGDLVGVAG